MKQDSSPSLEKLSPRVPWSMADSPMPLRKGDGSFRHRAKCSEVPAFRGGQRPDIFHLFFPALWHLGCLVYAWIRHQYVCAFFLIGGLKKGTKLSCFLYLKLGMLWHSCRQLPKLHVWRPSKRVWFSVWPRYSGICNAWQDELTTFFWSHLWPASWHALCNWSGSLEVWFESICRWEKTKFRTSGWWQCGCPPPTALFFQVLLSPNRAALCAMAEIEIEIHHAMTGEVEFSFTMLLGSRESAPGMALTKQNRKAP